MPGHRCAEAPLQLQMSWAEDLPTESTLPGSLLSRGSQGPCSGQYRDSEVVTFSLVALRMGRW